MLSQGQQAGPQIYQGTPRVLPPDDADRLQSVDPVMRLFVQNPRIAHKRERFVIPELDRHRNRAIGRPSPAPTWTGGDPNANDADDEA